MNVPFFIARRLIRGGTGKSTISAPIIKIAIAAIALGLIMMLIAVATGIGLQRKIREKVSAFNGHIQIYNYDNNLSEVTVNPVSLDQDFYPEFNTVTGIRHVQAIATKGGIIRTENTFEGIIAKGVGKDYDWEVFKEYLTEGRLPDYSGDRNEEVLISRYLADRLSFQVGDEFWAFFLKDEGSSVPNQIKFLITGIYDSGFQEFDSNYMFVDIRHIQRMNRWKDTEVGGFEVYLENFDELEEKGKEIYGSTLSTLDSQTIAQKYSAIFEWLQLFDFNIAIIIGIMIIVGGINMITALLVLILERTPMIGILKGLGASNWMIRKIFLYNASYLIGRGIVWGNIIGLTLLFVQDRFKLLPLDPSTYYVSEAPVYITAWHVLILNLGTLLLCLLMLLIPSWIVTRISPAKAIRFE